MQGGKAVQGASAISSGLTVLLAVVLIATVVTVLALAGALASGAGDNVTPNAVSRIDLSGVAAYVH